MVVLAEGLEPVLLLLVVVSFFILQSTRVGLRENGFWRSVNTCFPRYRALARTSLVRGLASSEILDQHERRSCRTCRLHTTMEKTPWRVYCVAQPKATAMWTTLGSCLKTNPNPGSNTNGKGTGVTCSWYCSRDKTDLRHSGGECRHQCRPLVLLVLTASVLAGTAAAVHPIV